MQGGGLAVATAAVAAEIVRDDTPDIRVEATRIAIVAGGEERFVVDTALFRARGPGVPIVRCRRGGGRIEISLANARFAATGLPADMCLTLSRLETGGWGADLAFAKLPWRVRGPLNDWLQDEGPLRGRTTGRVAIDLEGGISALTIRPQQALAMERDWTTHIRGGHAGLLLSDGRILGASEVVFNPFARDGVAAEHSGATIHLVAVSGGWSLPADFPIPKGSTLSIRSGAFETAEIKFSEDGGLKRSAMVIFRTAPDFAAGEFTPASVLGSIAGPARFKLRGLQYAVAGPNLDRHGALLAGFAADAIRVVLGQSLLQLGGSLGMPALELLSLNGRLASSSCTPSVQDLQLALGDGIVQTSSIPADSRVSLGLLESQPCPDPSHWGHLDLNSDGASLHVPHYETSILRPVDLLSLRFEFINVVFRQDEGCLKFFRRKGVPNSYLKVVFAPQHVVEEDLFLKRDISKQAPSPQAPDESPLPAALPSIPQPLRSLLADPSRLVFVIPEKYEEQGISCTLEGLLRWDDFQLNVAVNALPELSAKVPLMPAHWQDEIKIRDRARCADPDENETAIEFPYGIWISPHNWSTWHHSIGPVSHSGKDAHGKSRNTELWHTRLAPFQASDVERRDGVVRSPLEILNPEDPRYHGELRTVRAIASRFPCAIVGCQPEPPDDINWAHSAMLPNAGQAREIVDLSSNFALKLPDRVTDYKPPAIPFQRLMLSAFGASGYLHGNWPEDPKLRPSGYDVDEWIQDVNWGRDEFVLVSIAGVGVCFGHIISVVVTHERNFLKGPDGKWFAALRRRYYCEVREPEKEYLMPADCANVVGRRSPFRTVKISPTRTPFLKQPWDCAVRGPWESGCAEPGAFWMIPEGNSDNDPFKFHITAYDWQGRKCDFDMPLFWVNQDLAFRDQDQGCSAVDPAAKPCELASVISDYYNACDFREWRTAQFHAQKVALLTPSTVPRDAGKDGSFEVNEMTFTADLQEGCPITWPCIDGWEWRFYPAMDTAVVRLGPASEFSGADHSGQEIRYNNIYATYGFDPSQNKGRIFLDLLGGNAFKFDAAKSGATATPHFPLSRYGQMMGPVGGDKPVLGDLPYVSPNGAGACAVDAVFTATFNAKKFFVGALPKLLGDLDLTEICEIVEDVQDALNRIPQLLDEVAQQAAPYLTELKEAEQKYQQIVDTVRQIEDLYHALPQLIDDVQKTLAAYVTEKISNVVDCEVANLVDNIIQPRLDAMQREAESELQKIEAKIADGLTGNDLKDYNQLIAQATSDVAAFRQIFNPAQIEHDLGTRTARVSSAIAQLKAMNFPLGAFIQQKTEVRDALTSFGAALGKPSAAETLNALRKSFEKLKAGLSEDPVASDVLAFNSLKNTCDQAFGDLATLAADHIAYMSDRLQKLQARWSAAPAPPPIAPSGHAVPTPREAYQAQLQQTYNAFSDSVQKYQHEVDSVKDEFNAKIVQAQSAFDAIGKEISDAADEVNANLKATQTSIEQIRAELRSTLDEIISDAAALIGQIPQSVTLNYFWEPHLKDSGAFIASTDAGPAKLLLSTRMTKSLTSGASPPDYEINGELSNFGLKIMPSETFLTVEISEVTFQSKNGAAPAVKLKIKNIKFGSELEFIEKLAALLHPSAGPYLDIDASGATAGFRLPLPNIATGAFSLVDLSINPEIHLPFDGTAMMARLSVSTRHRPFLMSYGIYGGGGFVALVSKPGKAVTIEGALEFGAVTALSFGLADGIACVTAGIYFSISSDSAILTGYFRAYGCFDVIGLITVVIDFYLGLTYESGGNAYGVCTIEVDISFAFVTISVTVTAQRTLSGSSAGGGQGALGAPGGRARTQLASLDESAPIPACDDQQGPAIRLKAIAGDWSMYRRQFFIWTPVVGSREAPP